MIANTSTSAQGTSNGLNTVYSYPNKIFAASDLAITAIDLLGNLYSFSFQSGAAFYNAATGITATVGSIDVDTGASVTLSSPLTAGWTLDARSNVPETQPTSIKNQGQFLPDLHEEAFDRVTREVQDLKRLTYLFGIHGPDIETTAWPTLPNAATRANTNLGFDVNGFPTTNLALASGTLSASSIGSFLFARSTSEIAAGVTPTSYQYPEGNVLRYGADRTGATDCYPAIVAAMQVACAAAVSSGLGNHASVYFPHGNYLLATSSPFQNPLGQTGNVIRGVEIYGDSIGGSQITLNTNSGTNTIWLMLGTINEQNWIELTFRNMYFLGDLTAAANGFQWYESQGFRFINCHFNGLATVFSLNGTTLGDGLRCMYCRFDFITVRVIVLNNLQALNNDFYGCEAESITGHLIMVSTGGGGALRWFGGSIIMAAGSSNTYLLYILAGADLGFNNNTFSFYGVQTQIGQGSTLPQLFYGYQAGNGAIVLFDACNLTEEGGARTTVTNFGHTLTFRDCVLTQNQGDTYEIVGNSAGDNWATPGSITFDRCIVPNNFSTFISLVADSADSLVWGFARAINCSGGGQDATDSRVNRYAIDFDMNWQNAGRAGFTPKLKVVSGYIPNRQMPDSTGNFNWQVNLPNGAVIVKILAYRQATSGSTAYVLNVGTTANPTLYGSSTGTNTTGSSQTIALDWLDTPASRIVTPTTASGSWPAAGNTVVMSATTTATGAVAAGIGNNSTFEVWYY